jgi:hypothetical protein
VISAPSAALLAQFVSRYTAARAPHPSSVVDLWSQESSLLAEFAASREFAAARLAPYARDSASGAPDLAVGVAPWGARPVAATPAGHSVHIRDDASHVRMLEACLALAHDGARLFVIGMGFAANRRRGGVCASLQQLGLYLEAMLGLPRGLVQPDSGPGRILVSVRRGPPRAPVLARLSRDPASIDAALSHN